MDEKKLREEIFQRQYQILKACCHLEHGDSLAISGKYLYELLVRGAIGFDSDKHYEQISSMKWKKFAKEMIE